MVNFSRNGYHVSFDANGDPVAFYELINWQKNDNGGLEFVTVGHYDDSLSPGQKFNIKREIIWVNGGTKAGRTILSFLLYFDFTTPFRNIKVYFNVCACIRCLVLYAVTAVHQERARFS